jgi:hypothetical protein
MTTLANQIRARKRPASLGWNLGLEAAATLAEAHQTALEKAVAHGHTSLPDFIDWMADRLVNHYGDNESVDFIRSARERASLLRSAMEGTKT